VTITIYGTDEALLNGAVDRIATDERDRIRVVESRYSVNDLERFSTEAQRRLDAAGIEAYVVIRWGVDVVDVNLVTPDGARDAVLEADAQTDMDDVPAVISFWAPPIPARGARCQLRFQP
jgi:hypothetical protein